MILNYKGKSFIVIKEGDEQAQRKDYMTEKEKENRKIEIIKNRENRKEYIEEQRRKRDRKIAIAAAFLFVAVALIYAFWNRSFNAYEELTSTPNSEANDTQFARYEEGYMKFSKDGISYLDAQEQILWTEAYNMEKPFISIEGECVVVADLEGNEVQIYNREGKVGDYSMPYPVRSVQAAAQGVFCVVLEEEDANYIRLYNREGKLLTDIKTKIESNGYPLDVAISSDGKKMAASFYCIDGINAKNVISFYNFGEGGKGQSGNLVGTYQFEETLIPKIEFMDDETVCVVGDNQIIFYEMKDKPKKFHQIELEEEMKSVFSNEEYIGYICENPEEDVKAGKIEPYQIFLYDKKGKLAESFGQDKLYETVKLEENMIMCYSGSECSLVHTNGIEFFSQDMGQNIMNILPTDNRKELLVVYSDRCVRISLENQMEKIDMTNALKKEEVETQ